jgi:hypothetical protein
VTIVSPTRLEYIEKRLTRLREELASIEGQLLAWRFLRTGARASEEKRLRMARSSKIQAIRRWSKLLGEDQ